MESLEDYVKKSVGMTSSIERKIVSRGKKSKAEKTGPAYNHVEIMRDYKLNPEQWADTSDADKLAMVYSTLLRFHREAEQVDAQKREADLENNKQRVMGTMPTFSGGR